MDSRAIVMKIADTEMDDCARCGMSITSDTDKRWITANVYKDCCIVSKCHRCHGVGRKWNRLEHWHDNCYAVAGHPYGEPQVPKKVKKSVRQVEDWENE